jgi:hypothetical protein
MPTNTFRWALAFSCIELWSVAATTAASIDNDALRRSLEIELETARVSDLYLVIEPREAALLIKARGLELRRLHVADLALVVASADGERNVPIEPPLTWTVGRTRRGGYRRIILPDSQAEPVAEQGSSSPRAPVGSSVTGANIELPSQYVVELSDGWSLQVSDKAAARPSMLERLELGWETMLATFQTRDHPPLLQLRLSLSPGDARRLYHVLRPGQTILLAP